MSNKQIVQIYKYIQQNGNFLTSQKVLREVEKHPDIIWELICKMCSKIKNKNIENAYAQIYFMINDPDRHQRSAKWVKQFMEVKELAVKFNIAFTVLDYVRPQKDKIINLIYKIIEVSKGVNKVKQELDSFITKDEMLTKQLNKHRIMEQSTKQQLQQLKERKQKQRPLYDQIVSVCDNINQNITSKRQQKLDLISRQKSIKDEINKFQKVVQDLRYENQNKLIKIQQLKKQIAQNAPQVKKQKRAVEQEFQKLQKQIYSELQLSRNRQSKIIQNLQNRRVYKTQLIDLTTRLADQFDLLQQTNEKQVKAKQENDSFKKRRALQTTQQNQLKDIIHQLQMQCYNQNSLYESLEKERKRNQSEYRGMMAKDTKIKEEIRVIKQRLKKFKQINQAFKQSMELTKQRHEQRYLQLENKRKGWQQFVMKSLVQIYQPLQQLKFD